MSEEHEAHHETTKPRTSKLKPSYAKLFTRNYFIGLIVGFVAGVLALGALHYVNDSEVNMHYHANFALYVDGVRDEFKSPTYYEEVQTCGTDLNNPRARVHLHNQDAAAVHVHDEGATWGALFANLGYTLGDNVLKTGKGVYVSGENGKQLSFILNGKPAFDVANRLIGDEDVLLVSYGAETNADQTKHFDAIPRTAEEHNSTPDPSTCSGSETESFGTRVKKAFGLSSSDAHAD